LGRVYGWEAESQSQLAEKSTRTAQSEVSARFTVVSLKTTQEYISGWRRTAALRNATEIGSSFMRDHSFSLHALSAQTLSLPAERDTGLELLAGDPIPDI
jgi:hypothetical protein